MDDTLNITRGGKNDDMFYRYRMAPINIKNETNFTILTNIDTVANDLKRDTGSILKFFGASFGTQSKYDKKRKVGSLQGTFKKEAIQTELQKYIENFVLCPKCNLPETTFKVKGKRVDACCDSCGTSSQVKGNSKVIAYLLLHN